MTKNKQTTNVCITYNILYLYIEHYFVEFAMSVDEDETTGIEQKSEYFLFK